MLVFSMQYCAHVSHTFVMSTGTLGADGGDGVAGALVQGGGAELRQGAQLLQEGAGGRPQQHRHRCAPASPYSSVALTYVWNSEVLHAIRIYDLRSWSA